MSKLSFISASDRKYVISRSLSLIKTDVLAALKNKRNVVVKPYCFYSSDQLSSTSIDAIDAVLEFIAPHLDSQIILAEATNIGKTLEAFRNYNYFSIQDIYDFAIVDLNADSLETIVLSTGTEIKIPATLKQADAIISICPPRYDQRMLFAGTIVNLLEPIYKFNSSLTKKLAHRFSIKREHSETHKEFFSAEETREIFSHLPVVLSVIDAYSIKRGVSSSHLNTPHWASTSTDTISNDCLACQLLGIDVEEVDYLNGLISTEILEQNIVVGDDWRNHIIRT